jgi:lipopolysaccharide export system permease protein
MARAERRMITIRRFIYREVVASVAFATLAFLALFFFFDMVDELRWVGRSTPLGDYQLSHALLFVALSQPKHLYELLPITVLLGGAFVVATFAIGDYIAPASERAAQLVKARRLGQISTGATGAWLKERQGDHSVAVNVRAIDPDGQMRNVRIFEFDGNGRVASTIQAEQGDFDDAGEGWNLSQVQRSVFQRGGGKDADEVRVSRLQEPTLHWPTRISPEMVAASLLKPDKMATIDLFRYIRHLEANGQAAQRYEIEFWRKVFYPLSCLVMVVLSLPFAYLHFRSGGIAGYVFGGVMAGISFFLLNNVFGFAGNLQNWSPWLTAAAPGLIYSVLSLAAFGWLVLRR